MTPAFCHAFCISWHLTPCHMHAELKIPGVYYVRVPEDEQPGHIILHDPRMGNAVPPFDQQVGILPAEGELILFPSWLAHEVTPTMGGKPRVSIAFNLPGFNPNPNPNHNPSMNCI